MNRTRFGIEVARARIDTKTSLKQLGEYTGFGSAYHSGLENRRRKITWNDVCLISDFFRGHGHKYGFLDWYEMAKESNALPLITPHEEMRDHKVFIC